MRGTILALSLTGALMLAGCGGGGNKGASRLDLGPPLTPPGPITPPAPIGQRPIGQTRLLSIEGATGSGEIPASWDTLDVSPMTGEISAPQYNLTVSDTVRPSCNGSRCTLGTETVDLRDTPDPDSYRISSTTTVGTYNGVTIGSARLTADDVSTSGSTSVSGVRVQYSGVIRNPSVWGHWTVLNHSAVVLASQGQGSGSATYRASGRPSLNVSLRLSDFYFGYVAGASTPSGRVGQVLGEIGEFETLQWRGAATWVYRRRVSHGEAVLNWGRVAQDHNLTLLIPDAGIYRRPIEIDGNSLSGLTERSGTIRGRFYGPNAEEAAGWFRENDRTGVFAVKR